MAKKLTAASINKLSKGLDEKRKIYILGDYEVIINKTFKDSTIDKVVTEYLSVFESANRNKNADDEILRGLASLLPVFILREFSDVPMIPKTNIDIKELISVAFTLYDTGILEEVLNSFDQNEVQKVYTKLELSSKRLGEVMGELAIKSSVSQSQGDEIDGDSEEFQGIEEDDRPEVSEVTTD